MNWAEWTPAMIVVVAVAVREVRGTDAKRLDVHRAELNEDRAMLTLHSAEIAENKRDISALDKRTQRLEDWQDGYNARAAERN